MNHKDIPVFLIRIPDNPVSMYYAGITYCSWMLSGYNVTFVDAVTPETMHNQYFKLNQSKIKKGNWDNPDRPFSEGELAAQYTQAKMFHMISRTTNPAIVLEHDAVLIRHLPDLSEYKVMTLHTIGHPGVAYYITPPIARNLAEQLMHSADPLNRNWDTYLWMEMNFHYSEDEIFKNLFTVGHYYDQDLGNTMGHPGFDFNVWNRNKRIVEDELKTKWLEK